MVGVLKIQNALVRLYSMVKHDFLENFGITGFGCSVFCVQNSCLDLFVVYYTGYIWFSGYTRACSTENTQPIDVTFSI